MQAVEAFLVKYPELAVYLTIAVGYLIGRVQVGGISFGPVTGSLFAGLLIGQLADIPIAGQRAGNMATVPRGGGLTHFRDDAGAHRDGRPGLGRELRRRRRHRDGRHLHEDWRASFAPATAQQGEE